MTTAAPPSRPPRAYVLSWRLIYENDAGPLLPIFRSEHQLHLLGELFVYAAHARSVAELAVATGIPQATVSREVGRMDEAGLVRSVRRGRLRLVEANDRLPYYHELRSLLLKTIGLRPG